MISALIWFPIALGIILLFCKNSVKLTSVFGSLICLYLFLVLCYKFDFANCEFQFIDHFKFFPHLGINYAVGVDGLSVLFLGLTCLISFLSLIFADNKYAALIFIMQGLLTGVFTSLDLVLFYLFVETMLLPIFILILVHGSDQRFRASVKFISFGIVSAGLLLISVIYLLVELQQSGMIQYAFSLMNLQNLNLTIKEQYYLFWGLFLAFAIKLPIWPLHVWLPDAHTEAPTSGSMVLAGLVLKVSGYGMLRLLLPVVPSACQHFAPIIICLVLLSLIYLCFVTIRQIDLKKIIAYSSIIHMGFVVLGMFIIFDSKTYNQAVISLTGAIVQMIAHGFISAGLFLCAGILFVKTGTRNIVDQGGLAHIMPKFAVIFFLFILANMSFPGTFGFIGELLILLAAIQSKFWYALIAGMVFILSVCYSLLPYQRIMFGIRDAKFSNKEFYNYDLNVVEVLVFLVLLAAVFLLGIYPHPLLALVQHFAQHFIESLHVI